MPGDPCRGPSLSLGEQKWFAGGQDIGKRTEKKKSRKERLSKPRGLGIKLCYLPTAYVSRAVPADVVQPTKTYPTGLSTVPWTVYGGDRFRQSHSAAKWQTRASTCSFWLPHVPDPLLRAVLPSTGWHPSEQLHTSWVWSRMGSLWKSQPPNYFTWVGWSWFFQKVWSFHVLLSFIFNL